MGVDARGVCLDESVESAMVAHARRAAPEECCGLLIGSPGRIVEAVPAGNAAEEPRRQYLIDPRDHFAALRRARSQGLDVIGAYHSHPASTARPSATDAAEAFGQFLYVIIGLAGERPEVAAWSWAAGNFTPVPLVRCPEGKG